MNQSIHSMRDQAFHCYAELKRSESVLSHAFVIDNEVLIRGQEKSSLLDNAYWLWILGEYSNHREDLSVLFEVKETAAAALRELTQHWKEPQIHWLNCQEHQGKEKAIYLSNLAIIYGAVLSLQPSWSKELESEQVTASDLQQLLKAIRELLFASMIKDGKVVSRLGGRDSYGDIIVAAVPFGLLGIEDRILIEALYIVERELIGKGVRLSTDDLYYGGCERPELSCLLAWYYAEKGELPKAKQLLAHTAKLLLTDKNGIVVLPEVDADTFRERIYYEHDLRQYDGSVDHSDLASTLYAIASLALQTALKKEIDGSSEERIHMLHTPTGTDDPYVYAPHERAPRYPQAEELVHVSMTTVPFHPTTQQAWVEYRINGGDWYTSRIELEPSKQGEQVWKSALGRFQFAEKIEYRFKVVEGEAEQYSELYAFQVRAWKELGQIVGLRVVHEQVCMQFEALPGMNTLPTLVFNREEDSVVTIKLMWMERIEQDRTNPISRGLQSYAIELGNNQLVIEQHANGHMSWSIVDANGEVVVSTAPLEQHSCVEVCYDGSDKVYEARMNLELQDGERTYGMGERYSRLEYRGLSVDHHVYNEYRSQGMRTYMPNPFMMSSSGYGCYVNTTNYSQFHVGSRESNLLEIEVALSAKGSELEMHFFIGEPLEQLRLYSQATAKPALPPKWAFGPWMSSNNWDCQAEVMKQLEWTKQYEIPSTVIVLEQWSDEATFYIFNDAQYVPVEGDRVLQYEDFIYPEWGRWPNPKQMVNELHGNGLKVLLWQIPIQKYMYGITHEQRDRDEQVMLDNHYHIHLTNGEPYRIPYNWFKDCLVIDFTNKQASDWWFSKRQYLLDEVAIDGFKTDGGECILGHNLTFADGTPAADMHNRYPLDYVGSYYEYVQERKQGNGLTFSRSGYSGAQRYPMHWAGDERSTYEAFRASIIAGLTSGMSGIPFWGWDLAGFHGDIPTAELFIRSTQMATFCPVMQYHAETKGEFNQDRTPWNIAERTGKPEVISLYKRFADIRMNILPYVYAEAQHSSKTGEPMMRAMVVEFPQERACIGLTTQYMFGEGLLVAPVVEEGHYSKSVYLPEGQWVSLFGGKRMNGGRSVMVRADLHDIPVFIRQDHVIALNLDQQLILGSHVGNRVDDYLKLAFFVFPVKQLDYRFEDDLGTHIVLTGQRTEDSLRLTLESSHRNDELSYWIIRDVASIQGVRVNELELKRVDEAQLVNEASYCLRDNDIVMCCAQGKHQVQIALTVGGASDTDE